MPSCIGLDSYNDHMINKMMTLNETVQTTVTSTYLYVPYRDKNLSYAEQVLAY